MATAALVHRDVSRPRASEASRGGVKHFDSSSLDSSPSLSGWPVGVCAIAALAKIEEIKLIKQNQLNLIKEEKQRIEDQEKLKEKIIKQQQQIDRKKIKLEAQRIKAEEQKLRDEEEEKVR